MSLRQFGVLVLTAVAAGMVGYWSGRSSREVAVEKPVGEGANAMVKVVAPSTAPMKLEPEDEVFPIPPAVRALLGVGPVSDAAMHRKVMQVLEEPDPVRRSAAVSLLLENMSPTNADAFRAAFLDSTAQSGRRHDAEWGMMLKQYGKVLGKESMVRLKESWEDAPKALEGWATADPAGAVAWLTPEQPNYNYLRKTLLAGVALADPAVAFGAVLSNPGAPLEPGWIIQNAVLSAGTDGVTKALQQALDQAPPEATDHPAFRDLFGELTGAVFRQKWEARRSLEMLPWLESLKGQPFVTEGMIGHGAKDVVMQGHLTEALDWLDRMEVPNQRPAVSNGLMDGLLSNTDQLAKADAATLERIIARFPDDVRSLQRAAQAMAQKNPAHAARLMAAAGGAP